MRNSPQRHVVLAFAASMAGCCLFVPCDRLNHVGGYVRDSSGRPIFGAKVEFYGVTHTTDKDGCFFFGGVLAASGFQIHAAKPGYKPYSGGRRFEFYEIGITLVDESNVGTSQATWKELSIDQLSTSPTCKGRGG